MKKLIFALLLVLILASCVTTKGYYKIGLQEVERPEDAEERYGESKIVDFEEEGKTKYRYEDELIKIVWIALSKRFLFTMENKSDHSIKIIWDEAVYVDSDGSSAKVMHTGVKYTDRNNSQPPTVIVKKANVADLILPTDNVYYSSGWNIKPLFPNKAMTQEELYEITQEHIGKTVKILLPLQIQETVNEYIFSFKVKGFINK